MLVTVRGICSDDDISVLCVGERTESVEVADYLERFLLYCNVASTSSFVKCIPQICPKNVCRLADSVV